MTITTLTLEGIPNLTLARGSHRSLEEGACLLEAVAWFAGEPHTDSPACVDPFLAEYGRSLNDRLPDEERQLLKPFIARMAGTAGDGLGQARLNLAVDWNARVGMPRLLDAAGLHEHAEGLRALPPVVDRASRRYAHRALAAVSNVTWRVRSERRAQLKAIFLAELEKQKPQTSEAAVAVAVAADAAVAVAVAVAAAVDADAAADAAAAAAVAAAAAADADAAVRWNKVYWAVYAVLREKWRAELADGPLAAAIAQNRADGIALLERMIAPGQAAA